MLRLERRATPSRVAQLAAPFGAMVFTLAVTSLLVAWAGAPVGKAYALLLEGGFGSRFAWGETLTRATPLVLTGLAAAVAFRARLYNIGAVAYVHQQLLDACAAGAAVLLISEDLDEVFALADRIAVIHQGRLTDARPAAQWTLAAIGLAMTGAAQAAAAGAEHHAAA